MRRARTLAMMAAGTFGLSIAAMPAAQGQAVPRQLPPEPPPELPSVSDYSLPPGEGQNPANNQAEGPVEENTPPPQAAPTASDIAPSTQPTTRPAPLPTTPVPVGVPATETQTRPVPSGNTRPTAPVTNTPRATSARPPAGDTAPALPAAGNNQPQPGFTTDLPRQTLPTEPSAPEVTPEASPSSPASEIGSGGTIPYYVGGGIVLLLLSGLGAYFWRRNTSASVLEEEVAGDTESFPAAAPDPAPSSRKPTPKIYSPPNPVKPEPPSPVFTNGFVTSKIGVAPKPSAKPAGIQPIAPKPDPIPSRTDSLQIDFIANGASSTLLNAVLNYTIALTNQSAQPLRDIRLSGAMMQANSDNARNEGIEAGEILHEIESLAAGETVSLTGDIRLPLNAIRPITFKSQALFIPLARFGVAYTDPNGIECQQAASFIIGREYEPRRPKMAPFRLDLGPRIFTPVGQRPLNT
ncbi:MAG: hypothetical protein ABJP02_16180 [Parasphingorhabdus sp.]|uniref:hypothetical protein n=1 Tax=Parasphingorhabdus sp. TaxID=2709688 RepID=UPI0032989C36